MDIGTKTGISASLHCPPFAQFRSVFADFHERSYSLILAASAILARESLSSYESFGGTNARKPSASWRLKPRFRVSLETIKPS